VDSGQVGVFEERDEVSLGSFLESHNGGRLETKIGLEILSDFTNETLEATEFRSQNEFCQLNESSRERDRDSRKLANEKFGRLLVTTNLTKSDGSGTVSVRLLDTSSGGSTLSCGCIRLSSVVVATGKQLEFGTHPWLPAAFWVLYHQSTCVRFALCGPWCDTSRVRGKGRGKRVSSDGKERKRRNMN